MRLDFNHIKPCWRLKDIICLHPPCCLLTHCLCHLGCKSGSSPVFKPDCFQYEWHILWWHNCCRVCRNCLKAKSSVQAKEKWQGYSYVKWMSKRHQLQDCKAQGLETWHFVLPLQSKPIFKSAKSWHWLQWNLILLCGALMCRGTRRSAFRLRSSSQAVSAWVFALHLGLQNGGSTVAAEMRELIKMNIVYKCKAFGTNYSFSLYWIVFIITFD